MVRSEVQDIEDRADCERLVRAFYERVLVDPLIGWIFVDASRSQFWAERNVMRWECRRDCRAGGSKTYPSPAAARHYATAFDRDDRDELGRRAPLLGMFPLRIWHKLRRGP